MRMSQAGRATATAGRCLITSAISAAAAHSWCEAKIQPKTIGLSAP